MSYLVTEMTAEEELAGYSAALQPHLACLVRKDGVIHMEHAPDLDSAMGKLLEWSLEHGPGNFDRSFVRPCRIDDDGPLLVA